MGKLLLLLVNFVATSLAIQCLSTSDHLIGKLCYRLVDQQLTYADARDWCHYKNPVTYSYLASVTDLYTANFLASYATTTFSTNDGYFWIGLSRPNTSSPYQWDDGQPVVWTNLQVTVAQNYVAESIANGKWRNYGPDTKLRFACSYDPSNTDPVTTAEPTSTAVTPTASNTYDPDIPIFFLAYSSRFYIQTLDYFELTKSTIIDGLYKNPLQYTQFANVRLDNYKYNETIYYHKTIKDFSDSIDAHSPDWHLTTTYITNAYDFLLEFSNNPALCGSRIFLLLTLGTGGGDWSSLTEKLRENRVEVLVISREDYATGTSGITSLISENPSNLTYCAMDEVAGYFMKAPYTDQLVFSYSDQFERDNVTYFPVGEFATPTSSDSILDFTLVLTTGRIGFGFFSMTIHFTNQATNGTKSFSYDTSCKVENTDLIYEPIQLDSGVQYSVSIDYFDGHYGNFEIRIYY